MNRLLIVLMITLGIVGCSTRADKIEPAPEKVEQYTYNAVFKHNMWLDPVTGSYAENAEWSGRIPVESFQEAFTRALTEANLLSENKSSADYLISAKLLEINKPRVGHHITITNKIEYTVTRAKTGEVVMNRVIPATHTTYFGEQLIGVMRHRLAQEASLGESIRLFLRDLSLINPR